ncbi:uncharacterized protein LOC142817510 [Rhipicephalus microplus]|uniref:uncharacterized protein LOC142817510 n=1 Tax=Rhipicephalus microplus TaxID=6941 RepID=UPI003F6CB311
MAFVYHHFVPFSGHRFRMAGRCQPSVRVLCWQLICALYAGGEWRFATAVKFYVHSYRDDLGPRESLSPRLPSKVKPTLRARHSPEPKRTGQLIHAMSQSVTPFYPTYLGNRSNAKHVDGR